ncbi:uncharacterized protein MONOS_9417 [Monocercomonoides exilis]|uniref:uncharacterized protein n=1 Tax=Monocercomonoides exilis TaxID=2049356 RepID=UPI003559B485|nr:hypothetical protein MONOS_9417 [Monocercomonoides exilis]|eukprot:MONOS_9417.1-p1 / transcript=MONOS_9417.1 / gene=MONOS_9417 / organism=Monocercomonoides_exilis_PA203 / gene_product=unspecified product / transcript_product=unspecified product / location=Mono_scaffold00388:37393-39707(-) / protein_length=665 / sequence_SO=supercontig / SO=protein_coding / is_pseudo=false
MMEMLMEIGQEDGAVPERNKNVAEFEEFLEKIVSHEHQEIKDFYDKNEKLFFIVKKMKKQELKKVASIYVFNKLGRAATNAKEEWPFKFLKFFMRRIFITGTYVENNYLKSNLKEAMDKLIDDAFGLRQRAKRLLGKENAIDLVDLVESFHLLHPYGFRFNQFLLSNTLPVLLNEVTKEIKSKSDKIRVEYALLAIRHICPSDHGEVFQKCKITKTIVRLLEQDKKFVNLTEISRCVAWQILSQHGLLPEAEKVSVNIMWKEEGLFERWMEILQREMDSKQKMRWHGMDESINSDESFHISNATHTFLQEPQALADGIGRNDSEEEKEDIEALLHEEMMNGIIEWTLRGMMETWKECYSQFFGSQKILTCVEEMLGSSCKGKNDKCPGSYQPKISDERKEESFDIANESKKESFKKGIKSCEYRCNCSPHVLDDSSFSSSSSSSSSSSASSASSFSSSSSSSSTNTENHIHHITHFKSHDQTTKFDQHERCWALSLLGLRPDESFPVKGRCGHCWRGVMKIIAELKESDIQIVRQAVDVACDWFDILKVKMSDLKNERMQKLKAEEIKKEIHETKNQSPEESSVEDCHNKTNIQKPFHQHTKFEEQCFKEREGNLEYCYFKEVIEAAEEEGLSDSCLAQVKFHHEKRKYTQVRALQLWKLLEEI